MGTLFEASSRRSVDDVWHEIAGLTYKCIVLPLASVYHGDGPMIPVVSTETNKVYTLAYIYVCEQM